MLSRQFSSALKHGWDTCIGEATDIRGFANACIIAGRKPAEYRSIYEHEHHDAFNGHSVASCCHTFQSTRATYQVTVQYNQRLQSVLTRSSSDADKARHVSRTLKLNILCIKYSMAAILKSKMAAGSELLLTYC